MMYLLPQQNPKNTILIDKELERAASKIPVFNSPRNHIIELIIRKIPAPQTSFFSWGKSLNPAPVYIQLMPGLSDSMLDIVNRVIDYLKNYENPRREPIVVISQIVENEYEVKRYIGSLAKVNVVPRVAKKFENLLSLEEINVVPGMPKYILSEPNHNNTILIDETFKRYYQSIVNQDKNRLQPNLSKYNDSLVNYNTIDHICEVLTRRFASEKIVYIQFTSELQGQFSALTHRLKFKLIEMGKTLSEVPLTSSVRSVPSPSIETTRSNTPISELNRSRSGSNSSVESSRAPSPVPFSNDRPVQFIKPQPINLSKVNGLNLSLQNTAMDTIPRFPLPIQNEFNTFVLGNNLPYQGYEVEYDKNFALEHNIRLIKPLILSGQKRFMQVGDKGEFSGEAVRLLWHLLRDKSIRTKVSLTIDPYVSRFDRNTRQLADVQGIYDLFSKLTGFPGDTKLYLPSWILPYVKSIVEDYDVRILDNNNKPAFRGEDDADNIVGGMALSGHPNQMSLEFELGRSLL